MGRTGRGPGLGTGAGPSITGRSRSGSRPDPERDPGRAGPMSYTITLLPLAEADLDALAPHLQTFVEAQLRRLAESPATLSRPSISPPYPPGLQMYQFQYDIESYTWDFFTVFFKYGQD